MIDDALVLTVERLRDDLNDFRGELKARYPDAKRQVTAPDLRERAARIAETWMVRLGQAPELQAAVQSDYLADLNVHFQRLLTFSERAPTRSSYDADIKAILREFTLRVVIPLKQARVRRTEGPAVQMIPPVAAMPAEPSLSLIAREDFQPTAFLGHSFAPEDAALVDFVRSLLDGVGLKVVTGQKPRAERVSDKVKRLIEGQYLFVGLFTRREKLEGKSEWATSPWIIDEKAYAVGKGKKLLLLREDGVKSIGGIQGDYEFVDFSRDRLHALAIRILEIFRVDTVGMRT